MKALLALIAISSTSRSAEAFAPSRVLVPVMVPSTVSRTASMPMPMPMPMTMPKASKLHMTAAVAAMEDPSEGNESSNDEGASLSSLRFNLVKSIVGAGVLSLPAGE